MIATPPCGLTKASESDTVVTQEPELLEEGVEGAIDDDDDATRPLIDQLPAGKHPYSFYAIPPTNGGPSPYLDALAKLQDVETDQRQHGYGEADSDAHAGEQLDDKGKDQKRASHETTRSSGTSGTSGSTPLTSPNYSSIVSSNFASPSHMSQGVETTAEAGQGASRGRSRKEAVPNDDKTSSNAGTTFKNVATAVTAAAAASRHSRPLQQNTMSSRYAKPLQPTDPSSVDMSEYSADLRRQRSRSQPAPKASLGRARTEQPQPRVSLPVSATARAVMVATPPARRSLQDHGLQASVTTDHDATEREVSRIAMLMRDLPPLPMDDDGDVSETGSTATEPWSALSGTSSARRQTTSTTMVYDDGLIPCEDPDEGNKIIPSPRRGSTMPASMSANIDMRWGDDWAPVPYDDLTRAASTTTATKKKRESKSVKTALGERFYQWSIKAGSPINKIANMLGTEAWMPTSLDKECDKAARILISFCQDDLHMSATYPTTGPRPRGSSSQKGPAVKIPPEAFAEAKGLAIFTSMITGLSLSRSMGSGVVVARLPASTSPDGTSSGRGGWSPPSGFLVNSIGYGLGAGLDVYDGVCVLRTEAALRAFCRDKFTLGDDIAVAAGPGSVTRKGGKSKSAVVVDDDGTQHVWRYSRSWGKFGGPNVDTTVLLQRPDANAAFYGARVPAESILRGDVPATAGEPQQQGAKGDGGIVMWPQGARQLMEVLVLADSQVGESEADSRNGEGDE